MTATAAAPMPQELIRRGGSDGGSTSVTDRPHNAEVIPFPLQRQVGWIDEKLRKASCCSNRNRAEKYLQDLFDKRVEAMRNRGIAEDRIEKDLATVRRMFNNWLAGSIWPDEPGYDSVG